MNKYIIVILCNDDGNYYIDHINMAFDSRVDAEKQMEICIEQEYKNLMYEPTNDKCYNRDNDTIYVDGNILTRYDIINITNTFMEGSK